MRAPPHRNGAVLVAALVCLLISLSLVTTMVAGTLKRRAQLKVEHKARQAVHLLAAGHERGLQQLRADGSYSGETWEPVVSDNTRSKVLIEASPADDGLTRIDVAVTYPSGDPRPVRRSGSFLIHTINPN